MDRKDADRKAKDADRREKPGVIVAGPEAHAHEREGTMPEGQNSKPKDDAAK